MEDAAEAWRSSVVHPAYRRTRRLLEFEVLVTSRKVAGAPADVVRHQVDRCCKPEDLSYRRLGPDEGRGFVILHRPSDKFVRLTEHVRAQLCGWQGPRMRVVARRRVLEAEEALAALVRGHWSGTLPPVAPAQPMTETLTEAQAAVFAERKEKNRKQMQFFGRISRYSINRGSKETRRGCPEHRVAKKGCSPCHMVLLQWARARVKAEDERAARDAAREEEKRYAATRRRPGAASGVATEDDVGVDESARDPHVEPAREDADGVRPGDPSGASG